MNLDASAPFADEQDPPRRRNAGDRKSDLSGGSADDLDRAGIGGHGAVHGEPAEQDVVAAGAQAGQRDRVVHRDGLPGAAIEGNAVAVPVELRSRGRHVDPNGAGVRPIGLVASCREHYEERPGRSTFRVHGTPPANARRSDARFTTSRAISSSEALRPSDKLPPSRNASI